MDATAPLLSATLTTEEILAEAQLEKKEDSAKKKKADFLVAGSKNQIDLDLKLRMTPSAIAKDQPETPIAADLVALRKAEEMVAEKAVRHLAEKEDLLATDQTAKESHLAKDRVVADQVALDHLAADLPLAVDQAALLATDQAVDLVATDLADLQIHQNAGISVLSYTKLKIFTPKLSPSS